MLTNFDNSINKFHPVHYQNMCFLTVCAYLPRRKALIIYITCITSLPITVPCGGKNWVSNLVLKSTSTPPIIDLVPWICSNLLQSLNWGWGLNKLSITLLRFRIVTSLTRAMRDTLGMRPLTLFLAGQRWLHPVSETRRDRFTPVPGTHHLWCGVNKMGKQFHLLWKYLTQAFVGLKIIIMKR